MPAVVVTYRWDGDVTRYAAECDVCDEQLCYYWVRCDPDAKEKALDACVYHNEEHHDHAGRC